MNWLTLQPTKGADLPAVLIVEDDEGMRGVLTRGLTTFGYKPLIADEVERGRRTWRRMVGRTPARQRGSTQGARARENRRLT
jgi:hypothetical protein